jgi:hypothetical protein
MMHKVDVEYSRTTITATLMLQAVFSQFKIMIDKIVITLSDSGFVNVNIGDVHFMHSDNMADILLNVSAAIKKLAYFPSSPQHLTSPITYEEFKEKYKKKK